MAKLWKEMSYTRLIALSFLVVIFAGTILLMLPISARCGNVTPVLDAMFAIFAKKRIGLRERKLLMYSSGNMRLSGMIELLKQIVSVTFVCEGVGAVLLAIQFVPEMGWLPGIYYSVFHSVSAFCNAGFDLI